jgi:hypothetical protein
MTKIEQVREAIEACIDRLPDIPSYQKCKAAIAILKDMDGQEPVAWMYKGGDSRYPAYLTLEKDIAEEDADDPSSIIPLYAHPSPSAPVDIAEIIAAGDKMRDSINDHINAIPNGHPPLRREQVMIDKAKAWTTATAKRRTA